MIDRTTKQGSKKVSAQVVSFAELDTKTTHESRLDTGFEEMNRVLGGGIVAGSVTLLGGEPGIGKSTLLTQLVINILNDQSNTECILYVCGEENPEQILGRIRRVMSIAPEEKIKKTAKDQSNWKNQLLFVSSTDTDTCVSTMRDKKPLLVIVDSIQSMCTTDLTGAAGSLGQLRESTYRITQAAKETNSAVFLVGHVTKDGEIAGPKVLEHVVDAVLELWGERSGYLRFLRSAKNRFGATDEVGVFQLDEKGLREEKNLSEVLLSDASIGRAGSAVCAMMEGTRVMLVEVQALVVKSLLAMPRRVGRGIELSRIQVICAVLQKHCHLALGEMDVFVSLAGGMQLREPAGDLSVAMAIVSSIKNKPIAQQTAFAGEVGLLGEIRKVPMLEKRRKEAKRMGYAHVVGNDAGSLKQLVEELH